MTFLTLAERKNRDSQKTSQKKRVLRQTFANEKGLQIRPVQGVRKSVKFCELLASSFAHRRFE